MRQTRWGACAAGVAWVQDSPLTSYLLTMSTTRPKLFARFSAAALSYPDKISSSLEEIFFSTPPSFVGILAVEDDCLLGSPVGELGSCWASLCAFALYVSTVLMSWIALMDFKQTTSSTQQRRSQPESQLWQEHAMPTARTQSRRHTSIHGRKSKSLPP